MLCEECGSQMPDNAVYCKKCGRRLKKKEQSKWKKDFGQQKREEKQQKSDEEVCRKKPGRLFWVLLTICLFVLLLTAAICILQKPKKEKDIYGTWTDTGETIAFTFYEDGNLRIAGPGNVLGADLFTFTKEEKLIHLKAKGLDGIGINIPYEFAEDSLTISILGQDIALLRMEDDAEEEKNVVERLIEEIKGEEEPSYYGTWTETHGVISFTFSRDGKLRISGMEELLSVDVFTYREIDENTLQLRADMKQELLDEVGLNLDYGIEGDIMRVTIVGQEFELYRKEQ